MNEREPLPYARVERPAPSAEGSLMTFVSAAIFLYVGFVMAPVGVSGNAIYDGSVTAFTWMARIVGVGLVIVGLLIIMRVPGAGLIDLVMSVLATLGCLIPGAIWIAYGDMQGLLLLVLGAINGNAAWRAWQHTRFAAAGRHA